jgi:hypothetical protein
MRTYFTIILLIVLNACDILRPKDEHIDPESAEQKESTETVKYKSAGNDVADIQLSFNPDHSFELYMLIYPELGSDQQAESFKFSGDWENVDHYTRLIFNNDAPDLNALFDDHGFEQHKHEIVDEKTVDLKIVNERVYIWGIMCERVIYNY